MNGIGQEEAPAPNNDLNWTSNISYDLNGNTISKNVNYYNTLGNATQNQYWDILTNKIWNSETKYDYHGRPAFQTLSAPIGNTFSYKRTFVKRSNGATYNTSNFESNPESPETVGNQTNSLGWYYSNSNSVEPYQDITSYPFSRTIYSKLNPGKIKKLLGGNKVNGDWLQSYSFTMPAPGQANGVTKFITRDVHGVDIVTFTDAEGNLIKTARSGNEDGNKPVRTIYGLIKNQGYIDIHIPVGCSGIRIINPTFHSLKVYNLITESQVSSSQWSSLPSGFYRITVSNSNYYKYDFYKQIKIGHKINYYDFSTNYYDKAGRLKSSSQPLNNLTSRFTYNSLGQLQKTISPDEGISKFKYRKDGQIRFSQNSKQALVGEFSYTNYDNLGRPIESGVIESKSFDSVNPDGINKLPSGTKKEQQFTIYDVSDSNLTSTLLNYGFGKDSYYYKQQFLAGNVSKTWTENPKTNTSWYSYDAYGRVIWMVQNIAGLGIKTIDYEYDFATGKVTKVLYQKYDSSESFTHRYTYNNAGQLTKVETSKDNRNFTTQADYIYYENGSLKRTNLANGLQGIDYVYNLAGQLKAINHPTLLASKDPGGDRNDLFGMQLDYNSTDYARSQRSNISTFTKGINQYNGNINGIRWNTKGNLPKPQQSMYNYTYNKNNWLKSAKFGKYMSGSNTSNGSFTKNPNGDYNIKNITYDANGNIKTLKRNGYTGGGTNAMDDFSYKYKTGTNQLNLVTDRNDNPNANRYNDLKNQGDANYIYNSIGQVVLNKQDKITYNYNASGLVTTINKITNNSHGLSKVTPFIFYKDNFETFKPTAFLKKDHENDQWNLIAFSRDNDIFPYSDTSKACDELYARGKMLKATVKTVPSNFKSSVTSGIKKEFSVLPGVKHTFSVDFIRQKNSFNTSDLVIRKFRKPRKIGFKKNNNITSKNFIKTSAIDQYPITLKIKTISGVTLASRTINTTPNFPFCNGNYAIQPISLSFTPPSNEDKVVISLEHTRIRKITSFLIDNVQLTVLAKPSLKFTYDDKGFRIKKESHINKTYSKTTYYVRDAAGNPMAIVNMPVGKASSSPTIEHPIYGASRIGVYNKRSNTSVYQLTDHLGNVRAVVSKDNNGNAAALVSATDYYPGGMPMPGRQFVNGKPYRYGYQGEFAETDEETGKPAFEARLYDPRINRWLTVDPAHEFFSPYLAMGNNWINTIDPDGRCTDCPENAQVGDTYNHPDYGEVSFSENGWSTADGMGILDDVVIGANEMTPFDVGVEWLTGNGPRHRNFEAGDNFTEMLKGHDHIKNALSTIGDRIANNKEHKPISYSLAGVQGVRKYIGDYSTLATAGQTGNLAVTYLGSYSLAYKFTDVDIERRTARIHFTVNNGSSIQSATRPPILGYTKAWKEGPGKWINDAIQTGPMSKTTQTIRWSTTIKF